MRIRSDIWVAALLRGNAAQGHYGAVLRKGAAEAGAVYIVVNQLDGNGRLYGPPPGPSFDDEGKRIFVAEKPEAEPLSVIEAALARRAKIDPDIWIVEIENRSGK